MALVGDGGATDDKNADEDDDDEDEEEVLSVAGRRRTTLPISTSCDTQQHHTAPYHTSPTVRRKER